MLLTERLKMNLISEQDQEDIVKWRNNETILGNLFSFKGVTITEQRLWFEKYIKDDSRMDFIIEIKQNNKKIGTIGFNNIDFHNQKAEYGILIGETEEQGKGYAKEASKALLNYGFYEINLQKVYLRVFPDNCPAIKLYNNLGFVEEGLLKKEIYKNGKFKDVLIMAVFKEKWGK
jgi:diamine N-acetyltransferase